MPITRPYQHRLPDFEGTPRQLLSDVLRRLIRLETKLHAIAEHLKVDLHGPGNSWLDEDKAGT